MAARPLPTLSDMPFHIKQNIVNSLDVFSRIPLRECSREFCELVDYKCQGKFRRITFSLCGLACIVKVQNDIRESMSTRYTHIKADCCYRDFKRIPGKCHFDRAFADLEVMLRSQKIVVEEMIVENIPLQQRGPFPEMTASRLLRLFGAFPFGHKLNIRQLRLRAKLDQDDISAALSAITPGFLEHISITPINNIQEIWKITEMDQWRYAKTLSTGGVFGFPLENLRHFREMTLHENQMSPEFMDAVIQTFINRSETFDSWEVTQISNIGNRDTLEYLNRYDKLKRNDPNKWHVKMPGTRFHLEIRYNVWDTCCKISKIPSLEVEEV